ncbi:MAG: ATP-binding protein [bacterium]|nr:ATP-binding protein [bacterium]
MHNSAQRLKRWIIQFAIFLAIVAPVVLVALYSYRHTQQTLTNTTLSLRQSTAALSAVLIEEKFDRLTDIGLSFSTRVQFRKLATEGNWDEAIAILENVPKNFPYIEAVFLTKPDGILTAITGPDKSIRGRSFVFRDWYKGVSKDWKPYVSEVYLRANEPKYNVIAVAVPIKSDNGIVVGILAMQVRLDTILSWSKGVTVGSDGFIFIVDKNGKVAAHPKFDLQKEIIDFSSVPVVQKALTGQQGVEITYNPIEKVERLAAFHGVNKYNWGVVATQPTRSAFADRNNTLRSLVTVYSFIVLLTCLLAFIVLITLNKLSQSKEKLRQAKAKDDAILESIGEGIIATDKKGEILFLNQAAQQKLGFNSSDAIGKRLTELLVMEDKDGNPIAEQNRPMNKALSTGQKVNATYFYTRKDGNKFPAAVTVTPILVGNAISGSIEVFRDITKELQLVKLKDEFVSVASHELRTPMTAIKGLISMIFEGDFGAVNENLKEPLNNIYNSTERLIHLVNDLLNVARIEAGRLKITLSEFNIKDVINETVRSLQPIANEKGITLGVQSNSVEIVQADMDKTKQILNNLIGNSLKFIDNGNITVATKTDGEQIQIFITDTGIGISKENQKLLFGKFTQISSQQEGRPTGTGLGLHISQKLAQKMGGYLWIEQSEVGRGTTFAFSIPIAKSQKADTIKKEIEQEVVTHPDQK